jgi:MFS family permease
LGAIGLVRILPIIAFSLGGGVVADVIDRRKLLIFLQPVLLLCSAGLAVATFSGVISLWLVYGLVAAAAAAVSFVNPAQQALVPSLVPRERLTNALSLNTTTFQLATVLGPSVAGLIIAAWGVGAVYVADVVSYLAPMVALSLIRVPPVAEKAPRISIRAAVEGLQFVRGTPILMYTMALDFVATFCGSATALLPIFARDILDVGSKGYGLLYAAPSAGAALTGLAMAVYVHEPRRKGSIILGAVACYAVSTIVFGLSRSFAVSMLALAGVGAFDTVSMILRQTVRQTVTPDGLRGRMSSVNMVFVMGGPQLGEFEAGMVARAFSAPLSVVTGGVGALVATALIAWLGTGLRRYD